MKIPKTLKIGNLTYSVGTLTDSNVSHYGKSSEREQWIKLSDMLPDGDLRNVVFFHEVVHQILCHQSFHDETSDEKLVDCLANGLYQVLKENKLLK